MREGISENFSSPVERRVKRLNTSIVGQVGRVEVKLWGVRSENAPSRYGTYRQEIKETLEALNSRFKVDPLLTRT